MVQELCIFRVWCKISHRERNAYLQLLVHNVLYRPCLGRHIQNYVPRQVFWWLMNCWLRIICIGKSSDQHLRKIITLSMSLPYKSCLIVNACSPYFTEIFSRTRMDFLCPTHSTYSQACSLIMVLTTHTQPLGVRLIQQVSDCTL